MTENHKNQRFLEMMALMEHLDEYVDHCKTIQDIPFENVSPQLWEIVSGELMTGLIQVVQMYKETVINGAKILDNDAAFEHLRTVIEAD